jgi:DHA2 family multidrug resistance protein-like MFS transporter
VVAATLDIADGVGVPQRYWAHLAIGIGVIMSSMDGSIANVALPTLVRVLHVTPAKSIWVVNAYQLSVCMSLLIIGSLSDIYGYDRVYRICLALFTAASLACALSHDLTSLAIARFIQGMGGAGILGVTNAMLRGIYPKRELSAGIGRNALLVAFSLAVGPPVGSLILSVASWQWLFAINVPVGAVALLVAQRSLPSFPRSAHAFDLRSAGLSGATFALLILGIDGVGHGQPACLVTAELAASLICGRTLFRRQKSLASPLLPVDLLRIRLFALSVSTTFLASMAQLMAYVAIPFLLQYNLGRNLGEVGWLITPWPIIVGLVAPFAGKLAQRVAAAKLASAGLAILAVALLVLAWLPARSPAAFIVLPMMLAGLGYGIFLPPNAATQIGAVPIQRSGGASTMGATCRTLGQAIGAAIVAAMFGLDALTGARVALVAAAGIAVAGAVISGFRTAA